MKKILVILFCFSFIGVVSGCSNRSKHKEFIDRLNEKLPEGTDNIRLEKIEEKDGSLIFYYTILVEGLPQPTEEEIVATRRLNLDKIKDGSEFDRFKEDQMSFNFVYKDVKGEKIIDVNITPEDYN